MVSIGSDNWTYTFKKCQRLDVGRVQISSCLKTKWQITSRIEQKRRAINHCLNLENVDNSSQIKRYLLDNLSENTPLFQAGNFSKNWNPAYHKATESRVPLRALPPFLSANSNSQTWNKLNSESPPKTYQDWLRYYQVKLKNGRGRDEHRVLA